ncbi:MAG: gfo/Idh/MocA family oxidoreductase, partial [Rhodococcus sp. (in: high G+C Gram-positive bacteria)]
KTVEAKKFLLAVSGGPQENSNVHDAVSAAAIVTAAEVSASTGQWQKLDDIAGTTASRTA